MARLSKRQIQAHENAMKLLEKDSLSYDEKVFFLENFNEAAVVEVSRSGAFFTPFELANDFKLEVPHEDERVVDLCAGIGGLTFHLIHHQGQYNSAKEFVCIEYSPKLVEIGQKIVPEATWVCGDILDEDLWKDLGEFYFAYGNPPFGKIKTFMDAEWLCYQGSEFEYKAIEVACRVASWGAMIIPQGSCPFKYSGAHYMDYLPNDFSRKHKQFVDSTGIEIRPGVGIDTSIHEEEWKNTKVRVEVACFNIDNQENLKPKFSTGEEEIVIEENINLDYVEVNEEEVEESKEVVLEEQSSQLTLF